MCVLMFILAVNDITFYVHLQEEEYTVTEGSIILYDQVVTNLGNGYNTASGSFTALQHGYYVFTIFFQGVTGPDSDLGILVNNNAVCVGDAVSDGNNQGTCSAIVELQVGDVYGDVVLRDNGFAFTKLSDLYLSELINEHDSMC